MNWNLVGPILIVILSKISNAKISFSISGKTYSKTTDNNGIASLQLNIMMVLTTLQQISLEILIIDLPQKQLLLQ